MTQERPTEYSQEQKDTLKKCAVKLLESLEGSQLPESTQLLNGGLRQVLTQVIESEDLIPVREVPFFSLMTRDYLPVKETRLYFDFYSMAMYGELAFRN